MRVRALLASFLFCATALAGDVYYTVPLGDLKLTGDSAWPGGTLPSLNEAGSRVLIADGEGYVRSSWSGQGRVQELHLRVAEGKPVAGTLALFEQSRWRPRGAAEGAAVVTFTVEAKASPQAREAFYQAKINHYSQLRRQDPAGTAWFRFQESQARRELGNSPSPDTAARWNRPQDSYDLFTGGRAIAENLQLDRELASTLPAAQTVEVDSIAGITVAAMDFASLTRELSPAKDALAAMIPADQHALFLPSIAAARVTFDQVNDSSLPILQTLAMQTREGTVLERYQRQLGLHATKLAELLGPQMVKSLAITGSDPYFPGGTDVGILFESPNPQALQLLLRTQMVAAAATRADVQLGQGDAGGLAYLSMLSPARETSGYLAASGNVVIVTNSRAQLERLAAVASGKAPRLGDAPEYIFFRNRYVLGQENETAFLVLSDATIRRWCSARWRIAEARRISAMATMAQQQAQTLAQWPRDRQWPAVPPQPQLLPYGRLGFLTPIAELEIAKVSTEEADAYARWRDNYQRNWRGVFDPIAIRFARSGGRIAADVTVMPLIAGSDYRDMIELSAGASLSATSGDPHDALSHFVLAINRESSPVRRWVGLGRTMMAGVKVDPLSWLGASVALYADDDPYWKELAAAPDKERFMRDNLGRLPLALRLESTNALKLAAFMAGVRTMVEQSAPNLTTWEPVEHAGLAYVKISARSQGGGMPDFAICYAALPDSLVISLNEEVIKRSIQRSAARLSATAPTAPAADAARPATRPWLGESAALQVNGRMAEMLFGINQEEFARSLQRASWSNLEILNEWKRLAPAEDPVAFHHRWWNERLVCPGGGTYVWNDKLQTMESTALGCPESPRRPAAGRLELKGIHFANFGLTLESQGLRAKVQLETQK